MVQRCGELSGPEVELQLCVRFGLGEWPAAASCFKMALCEDEAPWFWWWPVLGMRACCHWIPRRCCASIMVTYGMLILP